MKTRAFTWNTICPLVPAKDGASEVRMRSFIFYGIETKKLNNRRNTLEPLNDPI